MSEIVSREISDELKNKLISTLINNQKPGGEFETIAITQKGVRFYIGESPFVTAQIIYLLHEVDDKRVLQIIQKSLEFLERIDYTNKRIYKYWYQNAKGTDFPFLPFDLDDTSVVNQALTLNKRRTVDTEVLINNRNKNKLYYTWLKPSLKTLIKYPSFVFVFAEYLKTYHLFIKNGNGLSMAVLNDSEIIVRMNVDILMAMKGEKIKVGDNYFPITPDQIRRELLRSLHYQNIAVYYLTLAKFQKHLLFFNEDTIVELALQIKYYIKELEKSGKNNIGDIAALYLSLAFINKLTPDDSIDFIKRIRGETWENAAVKICMGNKKFTDYHEYYSSDLAVSLILRLLTHIECMQ